jgi:radical SAM superfamily enzyme YgiQ (UPF0313 family)
MGKRSIFLTEPRPQIKNLDMLPVIDRSLIDYDKYHQFIVMAGIKYSMAIQATRGCPYECFYCDVYKTAKFHRRRSVEHLINEIRLLADIGIKRIDFIDDIFNVNKKECASFFELVLKRRLDLKFYFPTGLRGDILNKDMIDLMVEAGTIGVNLSLEHPSPRLQKVMRKNLNVEKLHENIKYIAEKYPSVVLGLNVMHGFPTETEEEALSTLEFIKSIRWLHFPYFHTVRIFPGTELEKFALGSGIPKDLIEQSQQMPYHEDPPTLPFSQRFTKSVKTEFLREYVLSKERLLHVLPYQMEQFTEDELNQKYNSYFPTRIKTLDDLLGITKIDRAELRNKQCIDESQNRIRNLKTRIRTKFLPAVTKKRNALRLILIDLTTYFSHDAGTHEYNVLEPPFGLMALLSYINKEFGDRVEGKIYKPRIDFDSYEELYNLIDNFNPDIIGVRAMTLYKDFFHETIANMRRYGITVPIIVGGPYPTASYREILQDKNINLTVVAEGEVTLADILEKTIANNKQLPDAEVLKKIPGVAFLEEAADMPTADAVETFVA